MAAERSSSTNSRQQSCSPPSPTGSSGKAKRPRTKHACDECRRSQKKCNGDRKQCQRCSANGIACTYSPHKSRGQQEIPSSAMKGRDGPIAEVHVFPTDPASSYGTWSTSSSPDNSPQMVDMDSMSGHQHSVYSDVVYPHLASGGGVAPSTGALFGDYESSQISLHHLRGVPSASTPVYDYTGSIQSDYSAAHSGLRLSTSPPITSDSYPSYFPSSGSYPQAPDAYPTSTSSLHFAAGGDVAGRNASSQGVVGVGAGAVTGAADYATSQYYSYGSQGGQYQPSMMTAPGSTTTTATQRYTASPTYFAPGADMQRRPISASRLTAQDEIRRPASTSALQAAVSSSQRHSSSPLASAAQTQSYTRYARPLGSVQSQTEDAYSARGYRSASNTPPDYVANPTYVLPQQQLEEGAAASASRAGYAPRQQYPVGAQQIQMGLQSQWPQQQMPSSPSSVDSSNYNIYNSSYGWSQQ